MKDFIMNDYKLYKRKNKYYIDFIHPETGKRIRESLKTSDEKLAQKYANTRYFNVLRDIELGISVEDKDLSKIFKEYVDTKPTQYNQDTVQRHWLPYLEEKKIKLSKLKQVDITRYYPWRRARKYQNKDVKDITLNRENCALRSFINFAMANGYLCPKKNLKFQQFEVVSNRRDEFSQKQTEELIRNAKIRYENTKHSIQKEQRRVLLDYIHFLQVTGIRCGTARKLTWENMFLDEEKPYYSIDALQNKVKKRLNFPISKNFANWLKKISTNNFAIKMVSSLAVIFIYLAVSMFINQIKKEDLRQKSFPLQIAKQRGKIFLKVAAFMILKLVVTIRCFTVFVIRKLQIWSKKALIQHKLQNMPKHLCG